MDNMPTEQRAAVIGVRKEKEHHNELKEISEGICEDMADSLMAEMRKLAPQMQAESTQSPSSPWTYSGLLRRPCCGSPSCHPRTPSLTKALPRWTLPPMKDWPQSRLRVKGAESFAAKLLKNEKASVSMNEEHI